jgi:S-adenosylmethionine:tRNA ribosyltransferase-isomerase
VPTTGDGVSAPPGARLPPEERGLARDEVRLLVSEGSTHLHARFTDLPTFLRAGDLLVVNRSATLPAALPAHGSNGAFLLHLSTAYGRRLWLAEPRWSASRPGPVPLAEAETVKAGPSGSELEAVVGPAFPGISRLRFVRFASDPLPLLAQRGRPIRYGYLEREVELPFYQTIFGDRPGSAEMPSAARPFTERTVAGLQAAGAELSRITLHTGVSSLDAGDLEWGELCPEPFEVPPETAARLNDALSAGRRIIAVGTTVVRALTSAWAGGSFRPARGMTRVYVRPGTSLPPLAGLLSGFHDPRGSHLEMLDALAGRRGLTDAYRLARESGYLWHEFGDVHLILTGRQAAGRLPLQG